MQPSCAAVSTVALCRLYLILITPNQSRKVQKGAERPWKGCATPPTNDASPVTARWVATPERVTGPFDGRVSTPAQVADIESPLDGWWADVKTDTRNRIAKQT